MYNEEGIIRKVLLSVLLGQLDPHEDNSPPDNNKAQPLPTRTTIPRTTPHQDNSPLGPLPRNKATYQDQNLGSSPDTITFVLYNKIVPLQL